MGKILAAAAISSYSFNPVVASRSASRGLNILKGIRTCGNSHPNLSLQNIWTPPQGRTRQRQQLRFQTCQCACSASASQFIKMKRLVWLENDGRAVYPCWKTLWSPLQFHLCSDHRKGGGKVVNVDIDDYNQGSCAAYVSKYPPPTLSNSHSQCPSRVDGIIHCNGNRPPRISIVII